MSAAGIQYAEAPFNGRPKSRADLRPDKIGEAAFPPAVLVVDDEAYVRRLTARMLRDEGFVVLEAASAEEALAALEKNSGVRLVLTDVAMPGTDGLQLAETVHRLFPDQPVMLMTAYVGLVHSIGAQGESIPILPKPFTRAQLAERVRKILAPH